MKIAIYAIALDEADFVVRFIEACAEADLVVVADTGSTDGTPDILRRHGATVHDIRIMPWRFDDARNAALALVPPDIDVCLSLDMDEIPAPGWRQAIEKSWTPGTTRGRYRFIASHHADGSPGVEFLNNRLHQRHGYRWRHVCHEGLYPDRTIEHCVVIEGLRVDHWPDSSKSRSSYIGLLQTAAEEEPNEPRMAHYLAREYYYNGRYEEAIAEYERYLRFAEKPYMLERVASLVKMANCATALQRDPTPFFFRALAESSDSREAWLGLAEHYYREAAWTACQAAALRGLAATVSNTGHPSDPYYSESLGHDLLAIALWNIGSRDTALTHARKAAELAPWDERLHANVRFMVREIAA